MLTVCGREHSSAVGIGFSNGDGDVNHQMKCITIILYARISHIKNGLSGEYFPASIFAYFFKKKK